MKKPQILKDLVDKFEFKDVFKTLELLYPPKNKSMKSITPRFLSYYKTWEELGHKKPKESNITIEIRKVRDIFDKTYYTDVSGIEENKEGSLALEYSMLDEWLGYKLDPKTLKRMKQIEIMAHCLWEMTFNGFTSEHIKKKRNYLHGLVAKAVKEESKWKTQK